MTGCRTDVPLPNTVYGAPADKYDYLAIAVGLAREQRDGLLDEAQRREYARSEAKYYDVWRCPEKYRFRAYPSSWSVDAQDKVRRWEWGMLLFRFRFMLETDKSCPYMDDVRRAIDELEGEGVKEIPVHS